MSQPTVARQHADWLSLVEISGPFVSLPVLLRAFPHGLDARDPAQAKALREAYEEWKDNPAAPGKQRAWLLHVCTALLAYPLNQISEGQSLPVGLEALMPEMGETLRPDFALVGPAGTDSAGQAQLLISGYPAEQALDKPVIGKHWKATPATRMMELLHGSGVSLGLVTNGEQWMLVYAPRGEVTGYASWYASLWLDEPITLRAFHSLLGVRRFFGVAAAGTLPAMLKESASDQQEVTDQLGYQVREAVEVLVQSFDALDKESHRTLLKNVSPTAQYEAALTVMMRLVFLFSAEERGLLHLGKPLYDNNYAVSTLQEQLQAVADQHGEEVLERRSDAWARLLASFRAVHGGIRHQDLLMQAYGGSLFDPDRYAFLEGRAMGSNWRNAVAEPLAVNNRVVLHLLNSLQRLRIKAGAGAIAETRRVSFRALGVEQIGHVYEGLLDHTAVRATEPVLGIKGTRSKEPEIPLSQLEALLGQGQDKLIDFLKEETGRSISAIRRSLNEGGLPDEHRLSVACNKDESLVARLRPFAGLIRADSFEQPLVVLAGSVFVTAGSTRRSTGAHYTPPTLTEPIVQHTLEPLVYEGPAEGMPRDQWKLKSPKEILALRVCDMAMGSGAFLVQVCRYLAERLTEAWENEESRHPGEILITPDGEFSIGNPIERLVPADANERIAIARRVVADRCLYGVDINPMAVEMAKLSLWLVTVNTNRPFTFLDHAFKCGDSLLGLTESWQLSNFSMRAESGKLQGFSAPDLEVSIKDAIRKRLLLEEMLSDTPEQILAKSTLHAEAEKSVSKINAVGDILVSLELKELGGHRYANVREESADQVMSKWQSDPVDLQNLASDALHGRRALHWSLVFPEIFANGGFDAIVGNPPFLGGRRIRSAIGSDYLFYLTEVLNKGSSANGDLCAFFFFRANSLLKVGGRFGLIATNTIAQGDTRSVGLGYLVPKFGSICRATQSRDWPGTAGVTIAEVWFQKGMWQGNVFLNKKPVTEISAFLDVVGLVSGGAFSLDANAKQSFQGSVVLGMGFILDSNQVDKLLERNKLNEKVIFPYLTGQDLNNTFGQKATRWVINFQDWPLSHDKSPTEYTGPVAEDYPDCLAILIDKVKPERTRLKPDGQFALRNPLPQRWWMHADKRPALYKAIATLDRVLVTARVSKMVFFEFVKPEFVFSDKVIIFPTNSSAIFAVLQSSIHIEWAWQHSSTMRDAGINYAPTDCFDTFPFPIDCQPPSRLLNDALHVMGESYWKLRSRVMESTRESLTAIYNCFHNSSNTHQKISEMRNIQIILDSCVIEAYGWKDIDLNHGFHETKQGVRYTISEAARLEVLDRLLALNHQRHAEEVAEAAVLAAAMPVKRTRKPKESGGQLTIDM